jgi:GT2 family glycosyltransferase/tetratricopeptide (TPR) repeat protein
VVAKFVFELRMPMPRLRLRRLRPTIITRADQARAAGEWQLAAGLYRVALERTPKNPPIWIQYGHALKESGSPAEAETAYRTAIAYEPADADAHLQLGHALKLQGKRGEAEAAYRQAWVLDRSLAEAARELAAFGWTRQRLAEAANRSAAIPAEGDPPARAALDGPLPRSDGRRGKQRLITRGDRARSARQWPVAARFYRRALDRNPDNPPIWVQYGHALKEAGDAAAAARAYRAALSYAPGVADTHLQLGHALKLQGKTEEAQAAYLRAFALDPTLPHPGAELSGLGWSESQLRELRSWRADDPGLSVPRDFEFAATQRDPISRSYPDGQEYNTRSDDIEWVIETIRASRLFDEAYYRNRNRDLAPEIDPVAHFVQWGAAEGRRPHPCFDPAYYLLKYPDVARSGVNPLLHYLLQGLKEGRSPADLSYSDWCMLYDTLSEDDRVKISARIAGLTYSPLISVVVVVEDSSLELVVRALASVERQLYRDWELWIALAPSAGPPVRGRIQEFSGRDRRVHIIESEASITCIDALNAAVRSANGEFILFTDITSELSEAALYFVAEELNRYRDADLIYGDEDEIDLQGNRHQPHFKPDWNPDLFCSYNYLGQTIVCRAELVREVGCLRSNFRGAEQYDLCLRMIENTHSERIRHIPFILYHVRAVDVSSAHMSGVSNHAANAARHALSEHFIRIGEEVDVVAGPGIDLHRVIHYVPNPRPLISLVIPTGGNVTLLRDCVSGVLNRTAYDNMELLILHNDSTKRDVFPYFDEIAADPRITIVDSRGGFNFSRICNLGVSRARGEVIGLVNDDIQVIDPGWLQEMVGHVLRPEVGAVGAMLYYPNDTVQHAGVILGIGGLAGHIHRRLRRGDHGYFHRAVLTQNFSCVTAACQIIRREVFEELGGFDEALAVDYNDVDFCIRLRKKGYLIVWTPFAELYHLETATRPRHDDRMQGDRFQRERNYLKQKWGAETLEADPNFNPNLRLDNEEAYQVAAPPRVTKPWLSGS